MAVKKQHCSASGGSAFRPRFAANSTRDSAPVSRYAELPDYGI